MQQFTYVVMITHEQEHSKKNHGEEVNQEEFNKVISGVGLLLLLLSSSISFVNIIPQNRNSSSIVARTKL